MRLTNLFMSMKGVNAAYIAELKKLNVSEYNKLLATLDTWISIIQLINNIGSS